MAFDISYTIQLIDQFSSNAEKIKDSLKRIDKQILSAKRSAEKATRSFKNFGKTISTHVSLPLGVGAAAAIHTAAKFDQSMTSIQSNLHLTKNQVQSLASETLKLAAHNRISAKDIAAAEASMAKYGSTLQQIKTLAPLAVKFAVANVKDGMVDMSSATMIGIRAVKGLGLSSKEIPGFLKAVTSAAQTSGLSLNDFYQQLRYTDSIFRALKVPYKDAIAYTATLALQMKHGGQSARGTRRLLNYLQHPIGQNAKMFKKLGLNIFDATGKFNGIRNMIKEIQKYFKDSPVMSQQAMDTFRGILQAGVAQYDTVRKHVDNTKIMQEQYQAQTQSLAGTIDQLNNSIQSLSTSLVESQKGPLTSIINSLKELMIKGLGMSKTTQSIIAAIIAFGVGAGPVLMALAQFSFYFVMLAEKIAWLGDLVAFLQLGFEVLIGAILSPFAGVIAAFGLAALALYKMYSHFKLVRKVVDFLINDFKFLIEHPLQALKNSISEIGKTFKWLYNLVHKKPIVITQKISTQYSGGFSSIPAAGGGQSLSSQVKFGSQHVKSTIDVNVNDPHRYVNNVVGKTSEGDLNFNLGQNMAYSR